jgi:hypothetical protein
VSWWAGRRHYCATAGFVRSSISTSGRCSRSERPHRPLRPTRQVSLRPTQPRKETFTSSILHHREKCLSIARISLGQGLGPWRPHHHPLICGAREHSLGAHRCPAPSRSRCFHVLATCAVRLASCSTSTAGMGAAPYAFPLLAAWHHTHTSAIFVNEAENVPSAHSPLPQRLAASCCALRGRCSALSCDNVASSTSSCALLSWVG